MIGGTARVLIRADASPAIGAGHWMRCLALAQGLMDSGVRVAFAAAEALPELVERCHTEGIPVHRLDVEVASARDAALTADLATGMAADWTVLDGYRFQDDYHRALGERGVRRLAFDDNGDVRVPVAELVLNQNVHASEEMYREREPHVVTLLGTQFALLRRSLRQPPPEERDSERPVGRVLLTLGGGDPNDLTSRFVGALRPLLGQVALDVVIGAGHPARASLLRRAAVEGFALHVSPPEMRPLFEAADVAVAAGGVTSLELASFGVPCVLVSVADNQRAIVRRLGELGAAVALGDADTLAEGELQPAVAALLQDAALRARIGSAARALVDGQGVSRVVSAMGYTPLEVRPATLADARLLFDWANDPKVREAAFSSAPIAWDDHRRWLERKLSDEQSRLFVVEASGGRPVGQVRFDPCVGGAGIDVSVAAEERGAGLGRRVLLAACFRFWRERGPVSLHADIKHWNHGSLAAFTAAGFEPWASQTRHGVEVVRMRAEPVDRGEDAAAWA